MSVVTPSWNSFTLRIPLKASVTEVYKAWTTQAGLEKWFLRLAKFTNTKNIDRLRDEEVKAGDQYHWLWFGYSDEVTEEKKVVETNGVDLLKFIFTGDCLVTVSITIESSETICTLRQENIPLDQNPKSNLMLGCSNGWTFYLANLKSILEGGIDLRNKNLDLSNVISA
jgi:uncharacterized protein YndB with AHSA1/START domain